MAFLCGYLFIRALSQRGRVLIPKEKISDFVFFYSVLGVLIGGRFGYVLFYSPDLLIRFSTQFPFWGPLYVNEGGMSSHGGMIGVALACFLFSHRHKIPFLHSFDLTVPVAALGFFFGRIANFINGELFGRVAPNGTWWAMKFPTEMMDWLFTKDQAKLQALSPVIEKLGEVKQSGQWLPAIHQETWTKWVLDEHPNLFSYLQFLIQQTQMNNRAIIDGLAPFLTPRYPSQLLQSLLEGLAVFVLLNIIWIKPKRPGVLCVSFSLLYGLARILGEGYRQPDIDMGYELFGLTRGQWLSLILILIGILLSLLCLFPFSPKNKNFSKLGGWFNSHNH